MDQSQDVNLEELFWRSPQHVQMMGGFLHSNNSTPVYCFNNHIPN
jgi:mediator of RNA polymerase II transcription subunit 6